jgi:hypothetical protein
MDGMGKQNTYERINKDFEKEILGVARVSNELKEAGLLREAWYCCLLVRLGELMISFGTRLKINYSPRPRLRAR